MPITLAIIDHTQSAAAMYRAAATRAMEKTAEAVAEAARAEAPVKTGALRDSITSEGGTISVGEPYALFVEIGTHRMPAQPFLTPAMEQTEELFEAKMREELA